MEDLVRVDGKRGGDVIREVWMTLRVDDAAVVAKKSASLVRIMTVPLSVKERKRLGLVVSATKTEAMCLHCTRWKVRL